MRYVLYRHVEGRHHKEGSFTARASDRWGRVIGQLQKALATIQGDDLSPDHDWPMDVDGGHARLTALGAKWRTFRTL